jgi:hypothetical protein
MSSRGEAARRLKEWRDAVRAHPELAEDPEAKAIAVHLTDFVDWHSMSTTLSNPRLAELTAYSERTVAERVRRLITLGLLAAASVGHGRTWKLRELTLQWQAPRAGHGAPRQAPRAGHNSTKAGTARAHGRHRVPTTIPETNTEGLSRASVVPGDSPPRREPPRAEGARVIPFANPPPRQELQATPEQRAQIEAAMEWRSNRQPRFRNPARLAEGLGLPVELVRLVWNEKRARDALPRLQA